MKKFICCIGYMLLFSRFVTAHTLEEQRNIYSQALQLQEQGQWHEATKKTQEIPDYPLQYLLNYQSLRQNFTLDKLSAIESFIKKNKNHKISDDLQKEYLYFLAHNKHWSELLAFYPSLPNSTDLKCYYFQAKIKQGEQDSIWPEVQKVWLTGASLPEACDNVFDYYFANNKMTQTLIWARFKLAYIGGRSFLMSHLSKLMVAGDRHLAKQLHKISNNTNSLLKSELFSAREQKQYSLLIPSIKALSKKDIASSIKAYRRYNKIIGFTTDEKESLEKYIIFRILVTKQKALLPWLDKILLKLHDDPLIEQRIRYAIKLNNWSDIEHWLVQLSPELQQNSRWLYWQARVFEKNKKYKQANALYKQVASTRTYYGFVAAQKLGQEYKLNPEFVLDKQYNLTLLKQPLAHIEELNYQQQSTLLKREWRSLLLKQSPEQQRQLGLYAFNKGWAHLSVIASIQSKSWDALNIRFPEVKPKLFTHNANKYQLDSSYIYAITRQESSFDEHANSPAGAQGYMQLMPQTAKETARKIGLKSYREQAQLKEGGVNVQLGSAYFKMLLKRYKGNRILATAAYNAGPNRIDRWKNNKNKQGLAMDSWIETIPYKETRRYVKNVLAYNVIYQHILEQPLELMTSDELNFRF